MTEKQRLKRLKMEKKKKKKKKKFRSSDEDSSADSSDEQKKKRPLVPALENIPSRTMSSRRRGEKEASSNENHFSKYLSTETKQTEQEIFKF